MSHNKHTYVVLSVVQNFTGFGYSCVRNYNIMLVNSYNMVKNKSYYYIINTNNMVKNCICNHVQFLTINNEITTVLPILCYIYVNNFNQNM